MLDEVISVLGERTDYQGPVYRMVEDQSFAATSTLVDDFQQQDLLESLLDTAKPKYKQDVEPRHYLIATPFRYPPLKWGSRFGNRIMPSYFYASEDEHTVLVECAYYRFLFMAAMATPYPGTIRSKYMMFSVKVDSNHCADLTTITTPDIVTRLTHKQDYGFTQQLGKTLTEQHNTKVIRYHSARQQNAINVAVAKATEISSQKPQDCVNWHCITTNDSISYSARAKQTVSLDKLMFCVDEQLPLPA